VSISPGSVIITARIVVPQSRQASVVSSLTNTLDTSDHATAFLSAVPGGVDVIAIVRIRSETETVPMVLSPPLPSPPPPTGRDDEISDEAEDGNVPMPGSAPAEGASMLPMLLAAGGGGALVLATLWLWCKYQCRSRVVKPVGSRPSVKPPTEVVVRTCTHAMPSAMPPYAGSSRVEVPTPSSSPMPGLSISPVKRTSLSHKLSSALSGRLDRASNREECEILAFDGGATSLGSHEPELLEDESARRRDQPRQTLSQKVMQQII